ncbi:MAG: hypothetical protein IPM82_27215, partial [Saprospiraceae bacterium]|nr:hypothetical protein [Saprospiraceae bacterium]
ERFCRSGERQRTVACPALATQPVPPIVLSDCGETITPTGPVIGATPTCEGTKTYTWTYTDCEGNSHPWSFVYTIERNDFAFPANPAPVTVACPALATQPVPPVVNSNCGEPITPTGPVDCDATNPLTCEGTRTYAWTYTDCEGNSHTWTFTYIVERNPFTVPANGAATVACPAQATQPVPPTVMSNCGEVLTPTGPVIVNVPNPLTCEGTRTYTWTYTDCEGNTAQWSFVYMVEVQPFGVPANGGATVDCPDDTDVQPTPPVVLSNCGVPLVPVLINVTPKNGCEGNRNYTFRYTDCEGNSDWTFIYTVEYLDFVVPASVRRRVECPLNAMQPSAAGRTRQLRQAAQPDRPDHHQHQQRRWLRGQPPVRLEVLRLRGQRPCLEHNLPLPVHRRFLRLPRPSGLCGLPGLCPAARPADDLRQLRAGDSGLGAGSDGGNIRGRLLRRPHLHLRVHRLRRPQPCMEPHLLCRRQRAARWQLPQRHGGQRGRDRPCLH